MYIHTINYYELNQDETYLEKLYLFDPTCRSLIHWANGKFGAMVDLNNDNVMRFVSYHYEPGTENSDYDMRKIHLTKEDELTSPIVAEGIVVYWLKVHHKILSISEIFNGYYDKKEKDYIQQNEKALDGWKRNFKMEFWEKHLQQVQQQIIISENIYPFLKEEDVDTIKKLKANYLEFVKSKMQTNSDNNNKELNQSESAKHMNMEKSVLDKITTNNWCYYYEGWRNGKKGGFVQKQGIYRFHEQVRNKSGHPDDVYDNEEENPIVAIGIVAYWLIFNSRKEDVIKRLTSYRVEIPKDIREQFENYTEVRFEQFKNDHRDDPLTWDWDWEYEFYTKYIIPHEMELNKISEALFDYISDSDINLVRAVMKNYIKYLKKCRVEKGYRVSPELLVLRSVDTLNEFALEDLEDYEINTTLDRLEGEGYVRVAWVEGHSPEAVRLLDKGRAYLKQLEEGAGVIDVAPIDTQQPSSEQVSTGYSSQMTQPDDDSEYDQDADDEERDNDDEDEEYEDEDEDEVAPEVREYDTTYDYIFDPKVKPEALFNAMKGIKYHNKITERRFYYVTYRVFDAINYFSKGTSEHQYLQWINLHFNDYEDRWIDDHDHIYLFRFKLDGTAKKLKVHPSKWNSIKMYSDLAAIHYKLANDLKNTFTFVEDDNGDELKDSESYEHLKDYPQYLSGAQWIVDKYLVPDDAYVNKGRQSHIK